MKIKYYICFLFLVMSSCEWTNPPKEYDITIIVIDSTKRITVEPPENQGKYIEGKYSCSFYFESPPRINIKWKGWGPMPITIINEDIDKKELLIGNRQIETIKLQFKSS